MHVYNVCTQNVRGILTHGPTVKQCQGVQDLEHRASTELKPITRREVLKPPQVALLVSRAGCLANEHRIEKLMGDHAQTTSASHVVEDTARHKGKRKEMSTSRSNFDSVIHSSCKLAQMA